MMHTFSVWREKAAGSDVWAGPLWVKCRCGWSEHAETYEHVTQLCDDHRADVEHREQLEQEEAEHA